MAIPTTIEPIRNPVKYVAELFRIEDFDPHIATAPNNISRVYNIFAFSIAPLITDPSNYWIAWGGYFDNPVGYGFQILMNAFLNEVYSFTNLYAIQNSFYIDETNNMVYMNIPYRPWQYGDDYSSLFNNTGSTFSSAPKDSRNLSDVYYGIVKTQPRMAIPSFNNKLNDVISGIITYNDFSIMMFNNDGYFDELNIIQYFNMPIQVSKTSEDMTDINDFNIIRKGIIEDIDVNFNSVNIKGVDQFYLMNTDFCRKFTKSDYPNLDDGDVNSDMPVAWGSVSKVPLVEINRDSADPATWAEYIALDPNYITACSKVYDSNGAELTFSIAAGTGVIRVTSLDDDGEVIDADSADVTGKTNNTIGEIVVEAVVNNENFPYIEGIWDLTETNAYIALCAEVGFYFGGGTTRELVNAVLKNDIAYLIQKNDGRLTIRQWGQDYTTWFVDSWLATKKPNKKFQDAFKYFCSSVQVNYGKNYKNSVYLSKYIDDTRESEIFGNYKRSFLAIFNTDLTESLEISDLAERLLERFGEVRETLSIGLGVDTFQVDLLDKIQFECTINDREFSKYSTWIIKEADPGQDTIVMEGLDITYALSFDGKDAYIDGHLIGIDESDLTL